MAIYLNTSKPYESYKELVNSRYFVDKTNIIEEVNERISTNDKYVCITRPRRFGKSSIINMLGAYYSKAVDSSDIFNELEISKNRKYKENLNKYNVIKIDFSDLPDESFEYSEYMNRIRNNIEKDLLKFYPNIPFDKTSSLSDKFHSTEAKFIFIFDEWDFIFNRGLFEEHHNDFLEFLRLLLKDKPYVALAYMTGILPIKKHSSGSALNMFEEFTFLKDRKFEEYFGFTEEEVRDLCIKNKNMKYQELESWYNGYMTATGLKIYNPRSVVLALSNNYCQSYWTNTGAMDEVLEYLKYNILEVRDDVIKMVNGEDVEIEIDEEYRAGQGQPRTREEIYSAMIVLGFLSYYEGLVKIPNNELMKEFKKALVDESFGEVSKIVKSSETMLKATVKGDNETVIKILHEVHNSEIPILKYNDENSLSCVITLAYLYARNTYRIEREEWSGKGFVDFSFHPRRNRDIPFIIELKKDESVDAALNQIKEKEYALKFKKEYKDREVLAVAICYNSKTKEHSCKIEKI
ncbi:MAG: AAA family ATPase [Romboutsia sp.]|uniref:AAA family ATPase n=1 Tax=Romboutsia sp. TaxID=1965302 RepID=UPI003F3C0EE9